MQVGIVTDSTCDLPATTLLRLGVAAVPLKVTIGEEVYRDWRDIEPVTLYTWMTEQGVMPVTSPPDVEDFLPVYRRYLGSYDHIISIHISGGLSDTLQRAQEAAGRLEAENRIHFIDSRNSTAALAEMVMAAAAEAARGGTLEEITWAVERIRDEIYVLMSPASLKWLVQGGRISRAKEVMGNILNLRPILTIKDGKAVQEGSVFQNAVVNDLSQRLVKRFGDTPIRMALAFAGKNPEHINKLKRAIEGTSLKVVKGRVQLLGPVVGAHLGPDTIAVCAYPDIGSVLDIQVRSQAKP